MVFAESDYVDVGDLPDLEKCSTSGPKLQEAAGVRPFSQPEVRTLEKVERAHILATLETTGGNKAEAARRLGIGEAKSAAIALTAMVHDCTNKRASTIT